MATPNRWAIRDAGIATFYRIPDDKPIVTLKTLKTSGLETTGETVYATGGFGNPRIVGFSSNRQARLTLQDAIFDNRAIAMLTGNDLSEGAKEIYINEALEVSQDKVTLSKSPIGVPLGVFKMNADGTLGQEFTHADDTPSSGEYEINGKDIEFHPGDLADGDKVVVYYNAKTGNTAKEIKVTSDQFGKTFKVVLDVLVRDEYTKDDYAAQIIVPMAKFEDNFNLSLSVDGDPAVLDLNMEILKNPTSTDMWKMIIYDNQEVE